MLKSAFECLKKCLNFLKDKEKEVLIIIAIATLLALSLEVIILCLQNQQIQASNKQVHFNRKTELIKFLYDTKSTIDCPHDKNCANEPKYNFKIRTVAFQEYINSYIKEDPDIAGAFLNDIQSPFVNIPVQININLNNFNADIPKSMKFNFFERTIHRIKNIISFSSIYLIKVNLSGASLYKSNLNYAIFYQTNLEGIYLRECNLQHTIFTNVNLKNSMLEKVNLVQSVFKTVNFSGSNMEKINMSNTIIGNSNMTNVNLEGANFSKSRFYDVKFSSSNMKKVNMSNAHITNSNLANVNLEGANMRRTFWTEKVDLSGANFKNTDIRDNFFLDSKLIGTDLRGANMKNIIFEKTFYSINTKWPKSFNNNEIKRLRENRNLICIDCPEPLSIDEVKYQKH